LQNYWSDYGCAILQGFDSEVGAGTLHPSTVLRVIDDKPWNVAYAQACRRPADARYGLNPNRLGHYYQYQVLLKPAPEDIQDLFLKSLEKIGMDIKNNDIRFVEDDWENPTVGASGVGWEVWCNGMEIVQFTYMQQVGGIECGMIPGELTYGLERIAMHIQGVDNIFDINYNGQEGEKKLTYKDIFFQSEQENSAYIMEHSNIEDLLEDFEKCCKEAKDLNIKELAIPAYEKALKASHILNLLDARGAISQLNRPNYIARVRDLVKDCCKLIQNRPD
jgi:glycyl-tRNA synthetase alpha chain